MTTHVKRILLVEDNPNDEELTIEALKEYNLANTVDVVRDGQEALDYLHRQGNFENRPEGNPVVILLDIRLPKVNGLEVLKAIRANDQLRLIPVVILSSSREERDLAVGYQLGVNAYVVKPIDFDQFITAVKNLGLFWAVLNESPPDNLP